MDDHDRIDIERELRAAMADRTAALPSPRIDLAGIRQRTARRRRLLVPVIATALALATAAPLAIARSGLLDREPTRSTVGGTVVPPPAPPTTVRPPGTTQVPSKGPRAVPPGSNGGQAGAGGGGQGSSGSSGSGAGAAGGACTSLRAPLTAAERAALASDAEAVLERAKADLSGALAKLVGVSGAKALSFDAGLLDDLLPKVGVVVEQVDCAGQRHLAAGARKAALDRVRAAVLSMGLVTGVVMDRTMDWLGLSAGEVTATVGFLRMTSDSLLMTGTLKRGGLLPCVKTITVTMRLPACGVTRVDRGDLGLPLTLSDLRGTLGELSSGLEGVVPGILEPDATIV
jgi:hypothetical protein